MTELDPATLPPLAFAFALVLSRTGMIVMLLPGLGEAEAPAMVRAGLALALAVSMLPQVAPLVPDGPADVAGMASMVAAELFCGAVLGSLARLIALSLSMAGALMSYLLGLSNVLQTDPALGGSSTALGRLFGLAAPVVILSTGLYALPIAALAHSYRLVAPGAWLPAGDVAADIAGVVAESFGLALRLAAPLLIASVAFQAALGLLARLVPQLQVQFAALPGQILGGIALLGLIAARLIDPWQAAVRAAWLELPGL